MFNKKFLFLIGFACFALLTASAQTQDTSGNSLLKGTFQFRHVSILAIDASFNAAEVRASYGTITFDGAGNYTVAGSVVDNLVSSGATQALNATGTYAIGSNGLGYVATPFAPSDPDVYIYGAAAQGIFVGSSTESQEEGSVLNDLFIAIPVGSAPTNSSFTTAYQTGVIDFTDGDSSAIKNALFELTPNGNGGFGAITLNGQAANQTATSITQTISGATYNFNSDGSATLTIPSPLGVTSTNALFTGSKTVFQSADGNFILGWTSTGYDIFFGVKALSVPATNANTAGLFFTAAVEDSPAGFGADSYYGAIDNSGDSAGDLIVHERLNLPGALSYDYGTYDQLTINSNGTTPTDLDGYDYIIGANLSAFVAIGTDGYFSLQVGLHAASYSGSGVYLNPIGVVNAASYQPITASLAPGELISLYGTGLASTTEAVQGGQAFPSTLANVSVTIDGTSCPIYYVSPTQLSVIVPYEVASNQTGLANIQVNNNGALSNVVQMYLTDAQPGVFSTTENGIGFAAALHAADNQLVSQSNPAQPGEYISLYLTGLGLVTPSISDGALGPLNPLSDSDIYNAGGLTVLFNDYDSGSVANEGTIEYAGLAPGLAGLYQINVQVPSSGLTAGDDVYIELITDASDQNQIQIPYGSSTPTFARQARKKMRSRLRRSSAGLAH